VLLRSPAGFFFRHQNTEGLTLVVLFLAFIDAKKRTLIPSSRKTVIKYNLKEYFGIDVQMKIIDLEFLILSVWLNSPMLS
jgi:hypothetical protein